MLHFLHLVIETAVSKRAQRTLKVFDDRNVRADEIRNVGLQDPPPYLAPQTSIHKELSSFHGRRIVLQLRAFQLTRLYLEQFSSNS